MLQYLIAIFPKSTFVRQIGVLASGTAFAQGLAMLALPVLTRLYSPADFNLLAVYVAIVGFISVVSCLRLNIAIPLPERDEDAMSLLILGLIAAVCISVLLTVCIVAFPTHIVSLLAQPDLESYLWMIPIGVLVGSVYNMLQYWTTRRKQFGLITRTRLVRATSGAGTQLAIGAAVPGSFGLLFGHMVYCGMGIAGLTRALWRTDRNLLAKISPRSLKTNLYNYREFPTRSAPASILDTGYQYIPILILASTIGNTAMGLVFLAMRLMAMPLSLIGASISQVYIATARERVDDGRLGAFTRKTMRNLFAVGSPVLVMIGTVSYFGFGIIFGDSYASGGIIVVWMLPWFILQLVSSSVSPIFAVANHQGVWVLLQAFGFFLIVGTTLVAKFLFPNEIVEIFSIVNAIFYGIVVMCTVLLSHRIQGEN